MYNMLHNETRERLVEGYERTRNAAMIEEAYGGIGAAGIQSGEAEAGNGERGVAH